MSRRRRSYEAGHKPKWLVVIDDTPECDRAVYFAARRAARVGAGVMMLRVIETQDRNQQWLGVADIMKAEAHEEANAALEKMAGRANGIAGVTAERVVREGKTADEILGPDRGRRGHRDPGAGGRAEQGRAGSAGFRAERQPRRLSDPGRHRAGASDRRRDRRARRLKAADASTAYGPPVVDPAPRNRHLSAIVICAARALNPLPAKEPKQCSSRPKPRPIRRP